MSTPATQPKRAYHACKCGRPTTNPPCPVCGAVLCPSCGGPQEGAPAKPFVNPRKLTYAGCPRCQSEPVLRETCSVCGKPVTAAPDVCAGCGRPICPDCAKERKLHADSVLKCPTCVEALHSTPAMKEWIAAHQSPIPDDTAEQKYCRSCGKPLTAADKGSAGNDFTCVVCHSLVCRECRTEPKREQGFEVSCRACREKKLA